MANKAFRLLLSLMVLTCLHGFAQTEAEQKKQDLHTQLKKMVDDKLFRFKAVSATTQRGKTIQLGSSDYFLQINKDSLSVDLPYYGRSEIVSYPATDLSNRFNTKQFTYTYDSTKKQGWEITIQPKDQSNANKIFISIGSGGYGTVEISSGTRDPISYYGTIVPYNFR
jgi:hypothetical protein